MQTCRCLGCATLPVEPVLFSLGLSSPPKPYLYLLTSTLPDATLVLALSLPSWSLLRPSRSQMNHLWSSSSWALSQAGPGWVVQLDLVTWLLALVRWEALSLPPALCFSSVVGTHL